MDMFFSFNNSVPTQTAKEGVWGTVRARGIKMLALPLLLGALIYGYVSENRASADVECTTTQSSLVYVECGEDYIHVTIGNNLNNTYISQQAFLKNGKAPFAPITLSMGTRGVYTDYIIGQATYSIDRLDATKAQEGVVRAQVCTLVQGKMVCMWLTQSFFAPKITKKSINGSTSRTNDPYVPCSQSTAGNPLSRAFSTSTNFFAKGKNDTSLLAVFCNKSHAKVVAGNGHSNQYIYKWGYEMIGESAKRTFFTGEKAEGEWFIGSAEFVVSQDAGMHGAVVALVCTKVGKNMECGCSDIQCKHLLPNMQGFDRELAPGTTTATGEGAITLDEYRYYQGTPGSIVTLRGNRFVQTAEGNDIHIGGVRTVFGVRAYTPTSLSFTIPTLPPGKYRVRVQSGDKFSEELAYLWIGAPGSAQPNITKVSPEKVRIGDMVTIQGSGFSEKNNDLVTTLGTIPNLASKDGKTITFMFDQVHTPLVQFWNNKRQPVSKIYEVEGKVRTPSGETGMSRLTKVSL
jgi:hypothetical protein